MALEEIVREAVPSAAVETTPQGEIVVKVPATELLVTAERLKSAGFSYCASVTAVDRKAENLLELVAQIFRMQPKEPVVSLRTEVPRDNPEVQSLTSVWPTVNWHEREAFDMFGIRFLGHPDLRRILLPENWQGGHPLLKDFVDKRAPRPVVTLENYNRGIGGEPRG